ncbi:hypothetical protein [Mesorhizobium sp. YR577]|nr:hypothetical protein [Mesorhizobium sp. YR577]
MSSSVNPIAELITNAINTVETESVSRTISRTRHIPAETSSAIV